MKLDILEGTTSRIIDVFIQDSSSAVGAGLTGLAFDDAGLTAFYYLNDAPTGATQITLATMTIGTWATGGFIETDAADMPGMYQLGIPNAALTGADSVVVYLKGANNMAPVVLEVQLTNYDPYDAVRMGLTSLPNAVVDEANGLVTSVGGATGIDDLATPTNITAGTIATVTDLTNLPSIPANWLTAAGINAGALDGKGNWNIGKTGYALTQAFPANFADLDITITTGAIGVVDLVTSNADMRGTDGVDTATMRGTDSAALATALATAQLDLNTITDSDGVILGAAAVDLIWNEPLSGHNTGGTAGKALANAGFVILSTGTSDNTPANTSTTISLESGVAVATDDYYNHQAIIITSGTGIGQARIISDYTGANASAVITPAWEITPDGTSEYEIIPGVTHAETLGGGYAGGAVWIAANGSTGSQLYVDGTIDNPIDDGQMTNAKTVADALNLKVFHCLPGSSVTLNDTFDMYEFVGAKYTLALGGQSVDAALFMNCSISGIFTGNPSMTGVELNGITGPGSDIHDSSLVNATASITANGSGSFILHQCHSGIAGDDKPIFDFGTGVGESTNLSISGYDNGLEIINANNQGTDLFTLSGDGQLVIAASSSGTVNLRGHWKVTNTGGMTIVQDDVSAEVTAILDDTGTNGVVLLPATQTSIDAIEGDTNELQGDDVPGLIGALNDVAATDIVSAGAINTLSGAVVNVDLVDTTTANSDMRGTDAAALASIATEARLAELDGANLPADVAAVKSETALIVADTNELQGDDVPTLIATLNNLSAAEILTTQLTEAYAADGAAPTLTQALMMIQQMLGDFAIAGTTLTIRGVDGVTPKATYTLDDATNPTSLTRAT